MINNIALTQVSLAVIMFGMFCVCWLLQDILTYLELIFEYTIKRKATFKSKK